MTNIEKKLELLGSITNEQGFLIYSRGGAIPYLTPDIFDNIFKNEHTVWHIPVSSIYEQPGESIIKEYGKTFKEFASLSDCTLLFNINDSAQPKDELYKYNEEKAVSVWAPSGRRRISPDEYMNILTTFGIDICIPPSDQIPRGVGKKRCQKSCDRSIRYLDRCIEIRKEKNLDMPVFGVLEGGENIGYRQKCAKEIIKRNVDGYIMSGYDVIGEEWKNVLKGTLEYLQDKKIKIMFGLFTPVEIVEAMLMGIHLFDSVICSQTAERGCALNFAFDLKTNSAGNISIPNKKVKQEEVEGRQKDLSSFEIDLHCDEFTDDMSSLVYGCTCYCCVRYTRAYLHHLLVTKEMLAEVLLMIHNLHHWKSFFKHLKRHRDNSTLETLLI